MVIILNGPKNSGKTTVAKILWEKIPNTALVEVDMLRDFIDWMISEQAYPISIENAVCVSKNFVAKGLNVIFADILSEKDYRYIMDSFKGIQTEVYTFTLSPDLQTVVSRGNRTLMEREIKKIYQQYNIRLHRPSFGTIIDNSQQTPGETAAVILEKVKEAIQPQVTRFKRREQSFYS